MKKVNNKGLSIIELLVCFVIVAGIAITLLNIIMEYKGIQETENIKNIIRTYKDEVTHVIQYDITKYTLAHVAVEDSNNGESIKFTFQFKNKLHDDCSSTAQDKCYQKELVVHIEKGDNVTYDVNDNYIEYPDVVQVNNTRKLQKIRYYLPKTTIIHPTETTTQSDIRFKNLPIAPVECISGIFTCNFVFRLYIPIEHSEIDGTYGIDIVAPITP